MTSLRPVNRMAVVVATAFLFLLLFMANFMDVPHTNYTPDGYDGYINEPTAKTSIRLRNGHLCDLFVGNLVYDRMNHHNIRGGR